MTIDIIHKEFAKAVQQEGIYHKLNVPKNVVAQYRWKLRRGIHITIDKKLQVLQKAGLRLEGYQFTDQDMVDLIRFVLRTSEHTCAMGAEYILEKWKMKR